MLTKTAGVVAAWLAGLVMVAGFGSPAPGFPAPGYPAHGFPAPGFPAPGKGQSPAAVVVDPVLTAVWCSGPRQCLGVGRDLRGRSVSAVWNGRAWRFVKAPSNGIGLTALGCSGWTECMAIGGSSTTGVIDEWNGVSWKSLPAIRSVPLGTVACGARHRCVALGSGEAFAWNGRKWSRAPMPRQFPAGSAFPAVACAGPADCMAVGSAARPLAMRWNGVKWQRVAPAGVVCELQGQCGVSADGRGRYVAVGDNKSSFWNGRSWHQIALPGDNDELPGVSCAGSFCLAVGSSSQFGWNGRKWSTLPDAGFGSAAVWCARHAACMDVGSGSASWWNGRRWTPQRVSVIDRLSDVSCARPGNCVAVGLTNKPALAQTWLAEHWNGSSWQVIPGPVKTVGTGQEQISCTSTRFCMALNTLAFDPGAQRWNGHQWIATSLPKDSGPNGIEGLSCGSPDNCVAVAGNTAWAWDGTSWRGTSPQVSGQFMDLQSVSCVSDTMCMAIGFEFSSSCDESCTINGLAEEWNGSSWSVSDNPVLGTGSVDFLPSSQISCPTATFCMEGTTGAGIISVRSWDGQAWTPQTVPFFDVPGISCGGSANCVVLTTTAPGSGRSEVAEVWNGTSWRATRPAPGGVLDALSCSRPGRCSAVGATTSDLAMAQAWDGTAWKLLRPANP